MAKVGFSILLISLVITACSSNTGAVPTPTISLPVSPTITEPSANLTTTTTPTPELDYAHAREQLVQTGIVPYGISDPAVIAAMGIVPRHEFVDEELQKFAYVNNPLPIGYGQTISQPYIVALMTQELSVMKGDKVLEIGTGSGYQAAILAELDMEVFTIEIIEPLANQARERFDRLGYEAIQSRHADGYYGWMEESPFDAIIVTAAPDHVPPPLLEQLEIGGVMVIPVGPVGGYQELWKITRIEDNKFERISLGGVRFVPFTRLGEQTTD